MATKKLHPCPTCKNVCMAHPKNHCADCYLAAQIVAGVREEDEIIGLMRNTNQHHRIITINERITLIQERINSGKMRLRITNTTTK